MTAQPRARAHRRGIAAVAITLLCGLVTGLVTQRSGAAPVDVPRSPCPAVFPAKAVHLDAQVGEWSAEIAEPAHLFRLDFYTGPPVRLGLLQPTKDSVTTTDLVRTWNLAGIDEGVWMQCVYEGGLALSRQIDPAPTRCVLRQTWNTLHLPENLDLACWR